MNRLTVFPCYARQDRSLVEGLADFLDRGTNIELFVNDGEIRPGETLISKAADGLQADVILVILSPDSVPARWVLEEWTPALRDHPESSGVDVTAVLCRDCGFPGLLRRRNFFDLTENQLDGFRAIKQWLLRRRPPPQEVFFAPPRPSAFIGRRPELEALRQSLGDSPGLALVAAPAGMGKTALAIEFAWRYRGDFEGVFWLHGGRRGAARLVGDLAAQVGLRLEGDTERNLRDLLRFCAEKRCLIVLDEVKDDVALRLLPGGRSSVLITTDRRDLPGPLIHLGPLSPEESLELSRQSLSPELIALLGGIPLPIAVAAALGPRYSFEGLAGDDPVRRLLDLAAASTGESGARLMAAMSACAPAGAPVALAARVAELDESSALDQIQRLQSLSLAASLDPDGARCCLHELVRQAEPTEAMARRHARAALDAGLPDIEHAFEWALSQQDPEAWSLAHSLARRAFSLTSHQGRLAEADEILQRLYRAAELREDRRVLEECAWERIWFLEKWDQTEEARRLENHRRAVLQDQVCFDFMIEPLGEGKEPDVDRRGAPTAPSAAPPVS